MAKDSGDVGSAKSSAAKTSSPKSKSEWREPQTGWIPIGKAVFRFGIADSDASATSETSPTGVDLFSPEAFEQFKSRGGVWSQEIAKYEPKPLSLEKLTNLLRDKGHARAVKIDQEGGRFIFAFDVPSGGASTYGVTPWVLFALPEAPVEIDPRVEAEALFNKEGLVRRSDEEAKREGAQNKAIREATGLVWCGYMLPAFERSVAVGWARLYARVQSALGTFQSLPSDLWQRLEVTDWEHGIARDTQGTLYYSIHAVDSNPATPAAQEAIIADETAATKALAVELRRDPEMSRSQALSWCMAQGYRLSGRGFQQRVWPKARNQAELPILASPGRKKKS
jgi:hypothetical protein